MILKLPVIPNQIISLAARPILAGLFYCLLVITPTQSSAQGGLPCYRQYIDAGATTATVASNGRTFLADQDYLGGNTSNNSKTIAGTADQFIYHSERWNDTLIYNIPVPGPDTFKITLYFAETYHKAYVAGYRIFDMYLEDSLVLDSFDIFSSVGANTAYSVSFDIYADDTINLVGIAWANNAKVNGIGIESSGCAIACVPVFDTLPSAICQNDSILVGGGYQNTAGLYCDTLVGPYGCDSIVCTNLSVLPVDYDTVSISICSSDSILIAGSYVNTPGNYDEILVAANGCDQIRTYILTVVPDGPLFELDINAGGGNYLTAGGIQYLADQFFVNGNNSTKNVAIAGTVDDPLYQKERYATDLAYSIPVGISDFYEVTLHFAETYAQDTGVRVFDMWLEDSLVLDDFDIYAEAGEDSAIQRTFIIQVTDDTLNLTSLASVNNAKLNAINVRSLSVSAVCTDSCTPYSDTATQTICANDSLWLAGSWRSIEGVYCDSLLNTGGCDSLVCTNLMIAPIGASQNSLSICPGDSTFAGGSWQTSSGNYYDTLSTSSGCDSIITTVLTVLSATHASCDTSIIPGQINFNASNLAGENLTDPTSLDFGPDGRLYVSEQFGDIYAYSIVRNGPNDYEVTATEHITLIKNIQNFNDDGTLHNPGTPKREVTGILAVGTPTNPVLYITSSDYRIGGSGGGADKGLCTNSGIISRLTWTGTQWEKIDLVRGLPRSEENHASNGMQLDEVNNILYLAQGGNTNAGAPSNNFAFTTEYALAAALLSIDLNAIEAMSPSFDAVTNSTYLYNLPTVDDPTRLNANGIDDPLAVGYDGVDINDPFGGNDGLNQAKWVVGGPVQVYSPGYRNIYDVVLTQAGRLYTWDNGPNGNWGGHPDNEGLPTVTNNWVPGEPGSNGPGPNDAKVNNKDGLHFINGPGYYGGHPNPIRANPSGAGLFTHDHADGAGGENGVFRTAYNAGDASVSLPYDWPPVDPSLANPIEADFQNPGVDDQSLWTVTASTNGMCEYTATNFGGAMQGDLLAVSWNENLYRVDLNASGSINNQNDVSSLGQNFGNDPLDVTAQGDSAVFPGTIWVVSYGSNNISVLEPQDFTPCSAVDSLVDEDFDGFSNSDELDNITDPCNGISLPPDFDGTLIGGFKVSNLNDPDDDDDGISDSTDFYVWDADNGTNLNLPFNYSLLNGDPGTGFFGLGFTGLMSNGHTDYLDLIQDEDNSSVEIIAGGAVGLLTFNGLSVGHPFGNRNDLKNAYQFGMMVDSSTAGFRIDVKLVGPIFQGNPQGDQFHGFYIGKGDQDNFLMMALDANGGSPLLKFTEELNGVDSIWSVNIPGLINSAEINMQMIVDPSLGEIQARIDTGTGAFNVGPVISLRGNLLTCVRSSDPVALGVAAGRSDATPSFNATWDFIKVEYLVNPFGTWSYIHNGASCNPLGSAGSCAEGRHEASYVQVGDKFVLLGGREHGSRVNIYDPTTGIWTAGSGPGFDIHHFQAVENEGLIYMFSAFNGSYPNEVALSNVWIYDISSDQWIEGPPMPAGRARGSAGVVVHNNKFYVVAGIVNGHVNGWVPWTDVFDPATNSWTTLADAPRSRDHFHAALLNGKIYCTAGRRTGNGSVFLDTEANVDVYDIATNTWSTLPNQIPTERAGAGVAVIGDDILVIGGEREAGSAKDETEALNTVTGNWRTLTPLNDGRHGTQAITNNGGVYVVAGSPNRGGGQQASHEVFFFGASQSPILNPIIPGTLVASKNLLKFPVTNAGDSTVRVLTFTNTGGNQAILLDNIQLDVGTGLTVVPEFTLPYHLSPGQSFDLTITYKPGVTGIPNDVLTFNHSGASPFTQVLISDPACPSVNLGPDISVCSGDQVQFSAGTFVDSAVWYVNDVMVLAGSHLYNHTSSGNETVRVVVYPDSVGCPIVFDTVKVKHNLVEIVNTSGVSLDELTEGYVIDKSALGDFSLIVNPCPSTTKSVIFYLDTGDIKTENVAPYAINGDNNNGEIYAWPVATGPHTLIVKTFSKFNGNGDAYPPDTINFVVVDSILVPVVDCHGDSNGTASVDLCGICTGGNTGLTPNASCTDCNGDINGTAAMDTCGICAGGNTGIIPDASCLDCNGVLNGTASIDSCGICTGGTTGLTPNATCTDCFGDINGTAVVDSCGQCVLGNTGLAFNNSCNIDCNGDVDGTAFLDNCGVCAGGNTGVTPDLSCTDCNGVVNGTANVDSCGVCSGGTTGLVVNATCTDCNGTVNGTASVDTCGVCSGGSTGIIPNSTCGGGCVPNQVVSLVLVESGFGGAVLGTINNGDVIIKSVVGSFSVDAQVCADSAVESVVFNLDGNDIRTESSPPYAVNGDNANVGFKPWNLAAGTYTLMATPYSANSGNGTMGIPKVVSFTVLDQAPVVDCHGDTNGTATIDLCGVCSGGNTGLVPNASCTDCNGDINGTAAMDTCGICAGGNTGIIPDASCVDCNGVLNGTASIDSCGICTGGTTGLTPNATCTDCFGDINGTAVVDSCGQCVLGNTGLAFNNSCNIDCNGDVDGTAFLDNCGVCAGGNTGVTPDLSCTDCNGVVNGTANVDSCGVCSGGTTGLVVNATCTDCNGTVNGTASVDTCGVCSGGSTGIIPNSTCGGGCVPNQVVSLVLVESGFGGAVLGTINNGDVIIKSVVGSFSVDAQVCADSAVESVVFNLDGNDIRTESSPPYAVNGDNANVGFKPWNLAAGTYTLMATPYSANSGNGTMGIPKVVSFTVLDQAPVVDCHGDTNGTATIDLCGVCSGGNTGLVPNASCTDCNGDINGTAAMDTCGICAGGNTGIIPDASCVDCNGVLNGTASIDSCGICTGGTTGLTPNATCTDCFGDINGTAVVDSCGQCVLGNTGLAFNNSCNIDCNGDVDGTAFLDNCGVCAGGNTGVTPDLSCTDCNGVVNGTANVDSCGVCSGGTTGLVVNATCTDCNGTVNGTASVDTCGVCSGGSTGIIPNSTCGSCQPNEVIALMLIDASSNNDLSPIVDGDTIDKSVLPMFSVRADVCSDPDVESVEFVLGTNSIRTENVAPYSVNGDNGGNYSPWNLAPGFYTLTATPYSGNNTSGTVGVSKTISFYVSDGPPPPPPVDCNGDTNGTAFTDGCGNCVGGNTGDTACVPTASCGEFIEINGLVVAEVESVVATNSNWYQGNGPVSGINVPAPSGSYYMWKENCVSGSDPNYDYSSCGGTNGGNSGGAITYLININSAGRYRFQLRSWQPDIKLGTHAASTENNDCWLQLPDGGGIKKKGNTEINIGSSEWVKVYQNNTNGWTWKTSTVDNSPHEIFVDFPSAGTYTLKLAGRSKLFVLDRFVLYRSGNVSNNVSTAIATTDMPPESPRGACGGAKDLTGSGQTTGGQHNQTELDISNPDGSTSLVVTAYPNPTTGILNLDILPADADATIELYDATGKLLLELLQRGDQNSIDLSPFANGLYWIKVQSGEAIKMQRVYKE